jgi:predicted ATP-dependent serine protease
MIAGPPGAGKSTLALSVAVMAGVPTLYASMDTHEATMALRTTAMLTGLNQVEVEQRIQADPSWASQILAANAGHITWMFDSSPSMQDLADEISLYREIHGENMKLLVVDNAIDVTHDSGDEFSSLRSLMRELKWWARDTGAACLVLHHTSESYTGDPCPPRAALHGKIAQIPSLICTIAAPSDGYMAIASVKNRYGPADPSGKTAMWMEYNPATMQIKDVNL